MIKTYGTLKLEERFWNVSAEPHVMIKVKSLFSKVSKHEFGTVTLLNTPENCADLEWLLLRYPLIVENQVELKQGANEYRKVIEDINNILTPDYEPQHYEMILPPRKYQAVATDLYNLKGFLLVADDVGLGKTVVAISSFTDSKKLPALVVCQTHLAKQWYFEIKKFLPRTKIHIIKTGINYRIPIADVYIVTYSKLGKWAEVFGKGYIKSVVFDECQELRRTDSLKWKAAKHISGSTKHSLGLSATPIYNYGIEIFNVMDCIKDNCLGSREEFLREWCMSGGGYADTERIQDPKAFGAYMRESSLMIRRTRVEVGRELPPVEKLPYMIEIDENVLDEIKDDAMELARIILSGKFTERGQAARELDYKLRQKTGIAKSPYVAQFVRMLMESNEKILLYAWHREVYTLLLNKLSQYKPVLYTGSESPREKERSLEKFIKGDSRIMLMSLRSGTGLNGLQEVCNTVVFAELDWSPEVHNQCVGRLARDGQTKNVVAFYLLTESGSDPVIAETLGIKRGQSEPILNPSKEVVEMFQGDINRVTKLAEDYLKKHHTKTKITI